MILSPIAETPRYLKAVIYGEFGVGKTQLCGTACDDPDMQDSLLVCVEDGALTLSNASVMRTPLITTLAQLDEIHTGLYKRDKQWARFKTVLIDGVSALNQLALRIVVASNCASNPNKDPNFPSQRDYGQTTFIMSRLLHNFFSLPMNVICTGLLRKGFDTDDEQEKLKRGPRICAPDVTPKVRDILCSTADMVWPLQAQESGKRLLLTQRKGPWIAKTRGAQFAKALGPVVEDPTLPKIMAILRSTQPTRER